MKTSDFLDKNYRKIIIIVFLLSIIPFVVLSLYDRPSADDYSYTLITHEAVKSGGLLFSLLKAAIETDIEFYNNWQGLYVSAFLLSLQPGIFGEQYYFFGAVIMMILIFLAIYYLINTINKTYKFELNSLFVSIIIYSTFLQSMPSPLQGLYWFNGAWNYVPFLLLVLVNMGVIMKYLSSTDDSIRYCVVSSVISFLISGGNHVTSFLNIMLLFFICVYSVLIKKKKLIIISFVAALCGFAIMFFAPGTLVRMNETEGIDLVTTIINTAKRYIWNSIIWSDLKWISYLIMITPIALVIRGKVKIYRLIHPFVLFLFFSMLICGMMAVPYYSIGTFGSGRIKNIYYFAYMFFSGLLWIYLLLYLNDKYKIIQNLLDKLGNKKLSILFIGLSFIICLGNSNMLSVCDDLFSGRAQAFAKKNDERYEIMKEYTGSDILIFEELPECENLFFSDLSDDMDDWRNSSWAKYYGVECAIKKK